MDTNKIIFAPQLYIMPGTRDIGFYEKAFGAIVLRYFLNDDGSIHVAELSIDGALFHLHEETPRSGFLSPATNGKITAIIGMFVPDVDAIVTTAVAAGAEIVSPAQDYDYGYRQAEIRDPFGHVWMIEKKIKT